MLIEVDGVPHRVSRDDGGLVRNPAPAVVVSIPVEPGDEVAAGDLVAVVEIMKMESSLTAPFAGRVREVLAGPNVHVGPQEPLVRIEPLDADAAESDGERVRLSVGDQVSAERSAFCRENLRRLEWIVLGYDAEQGELGRILEGLYGAYSDALATDPLLVRGEHRLLTVYADLQVLNRPHHDEADPDAELVRSPREYLNSYLRSLDIEAEGLPPRFVGDLRRALSHYGVEELDRTAQLEEACYRLFLSQRRAERARAAIVALLDRRLEQVEALAGRLGDDFREALDRLTVATQGRDQILADLAHETRFRYFDQPLIEAAAAESYREAEAELEALSADPEGVGRADRIEALVACPRPLATLLSEGLREAAEPLRRALLEAMTRRYYRMRALSEFEVLELDGGTFLTATHPHGDGLRRVVASYIDLGDLPTATTALAAYAASLPEGEDLVADFYAEYEGEPPAQEELAERLASELDRAGLAGGVERVVFGVAEPTRGRGMSAVDLFTFRRGDDGMVEDEVLRGLHPEMADRLRLWRLSNFALEQLPSTAEDIYLFHGTAHQNPKDERVFALAEVRDLTPVRDQQGHLTSLPELERMLVGALEGIRRFQAHRKRSRRLVWNRVMLHVWPVIEDLTPAEMEPMMKRLGPVTRGLGIEMLLVNARIREPDGSERPRVIRFFPSGSGVVVEIEDPPNRPLMPYDEGGERIVSARRRGTRAPGRDRQDDRPRALGRRHGAGAAGRGFRRARPRPERRSWCPCSAPWRPIRRGSWWAWCATTPSAIRRECGGSPCSAIRPRRWARWPSRSAAGSSPPSTSPPSSARRWSGSRSRPGRRSRWTAAPRTWTGSRRCCAGSSSTPRPEGS